MTAENIMCFLNDDLKNKLKIKTEEEVTSTNTIVKDMAKKGETEHFILIADSQTEGRGRLGRTFYSPEKTGLYFSILLKPIIKTQDSVLITTAAAVSVVDSLERLGIKNAKIKWVNDVFVNDKKVCGILTEGNINALTKELDFVVLGVGINLFSPQKNFPEDIKNIAGSVFSEYNDELKSKFAAYFLNAFYEHYKNLQNRTFLKKYREKCFVLGQTVKIVKNGEVIKAKAVSINDNFGLEVEFFNHKREILTSGEISIEI